LRLTLTGATPAHARLVARLGELQDEARALGFRLAGDCWVERLRLETRAPPSSRQVDAFDVEGLVAAAANDPEFAVGLAELVASVAEKLPRDLRDGFLAVDPARRAALARDLLAGARA
jgi:hypothetical protein